MTLYISVLFAAHIRCRAERAHDIYLFVCRVVEFRSFYVSVSGNPSRTSLMIQVIETYNDDDENVYGRRLVAVVADCSSTYPTLYTHVYGSVFVFL